MAEDALTVAVVDFTNNSGEYLRDVGRSASEVLSVLLVQTGRFNVVERDKLKAIITEHGLVGSGLVDLNESAIQVGRLLGADFIITGSVVSFGERIVQFKGYGLDTKKTIGEMTVSVKALNVTSGKIEFASLYTSEVDDGSTGALQTDRTDMTRQLLTHTLQSATNQLVESITLEKEALKTETVGISFVSFPDGAEVEINGVYYGSTPLSIQVRPGVHEVTVSLAGFNSWTKRINAYEGLEVRAVLEERASSEANHGGE